MKIISWNVNGIRACAKKGFLTYLENENPDICCLQEIKANEEDIPDSLLNPFGYHNIFHSAQKKGYSGVGIYTKEKPIFVSEGFGFDQYDCEGRVIVAQYNDFTLLNIYFPNGQRDLARLQYKLDFYEDLFKYCEELKKDGQKLIICGDYNTAHKEIDIARPKENENNSGFLPVERAWMDKLLDDYGYIDTFRHFSNEKDQYSWWSFRTAARKRNIGWRIDYVLITPDLLPVLKDAFIQQDVMGSDHCPVGINLDL